MAKRTILQQRIDDLVEEHGSLRAVSRQTGIDLSFLWRMRKGLKNCESPETLEKLGLRLEMIVQE